MAPKKTKEEKQQEARDFLTGLLATVPEDKREAVRAAIAGVEDVEASAAYVAERTLGRQEFSRSMDAAAAREKDADALLTSLTDERQKVWDWWETNKAALEEAKTFKAAHPPKPEDKPPPVVPPNALTKEQFDKALDERLQAFGAEALPLMEAYAGLGTVHLKTFDEALSNQDFERIRQHATKQKVSLLDAYKDLYKEQFTALDKKAADDHDEKIRKDERDKVVAEVAARQGVPYVAPGPAGISPIDVITLSPEDQKKAADAADPALLAAEYLQKVATASPDDPNWVGG